MQLRAFALVASLISTAFAAATNEVVFKPTETDDLLVNPGMGLQTFKCFVDSPSVTLSVKKRLDASSLPWIAWDQTNSPGSTIAYTRYPWSELEPREGVYDFSAIEEDLAHAKRCGQQLAFGVEPYPRAFNRKGSGKTASVEKSDYEFSSYTPEWFLKKHKGRISAAPTNSAITNWEVDFNDPYYLDKQCEFVRALARKFNGHPDLCFLDLRSVGYWGEWHTWEKNSTWLAEKSWKRIIDLYTGVFDKTPLVIPIQAHEVNALAYAAGKGTGWRYDGLGWPTPETFPEMLKREGVQDAWKRGPVAFETGPHTIGDHCVFRFDRKSFDLLLQLHVSSLHTLTLLPKKADERHNLDEFLKKCGYRFVVRSVTAPAQLKPGMTNRIGFVLENKGVAPVYRSYVYSIKLERDGSSSPAAVHRSSRDVRAWLPGTHSFSEDLVVPKGVTPGTYHLLVALLDPNPGRPSIKFAIEGRQADGWYRIGEIRVEN